MLKSFCEDWESGKCFFTKPPMHTCYRFLVVCFHIFKRMRESKENAPKNSGEGEQTAGEPLPLPVSSRCSHTLTGVYHFLTARILSVPSRLPLCGNSLIPLITPFLLCLLLKIVIFYKQYKGFLEKEHCRDFKII